MIIGVPREIKKEEYRVGITPSGVAELTRDGHLLLVEHGAGAGSGFTDGEYRASGAEITERKPLFERSDLVVKVKEPVAAEFDLLREGQALFTYLHLAPNRELTDLLLHRKVAGFAYETLEKDGGLPLLTPMSEIAGRMAPLMGACFLQKVYGGEGVLPTGAVGVKPAKTVILGAGVVGTNAARISLGLGMDTVVINNTVNKLQKIDEMFLGRIKTLPLSAQNVQDEIRDADIIIGAVLVPGGRTPLLITREMLSALRQGAVVVDVSVDQGGCIETSRPTTHDNPVYLVDGILHYAVANMPGAYPRTSTLALTNVTLPYVRLLAGKGVERSMLEDPQLRSAVNTYGGKIMHPALAESLASWRG